MTCACVSPCGTNIRDKFALSKQHLRNYFMKGTVEVFNHRADENGLKARTTCSSPSPTRATATAGSQLRPVARLPDTVGRVERRGAVIEVSGSGLTTQPLPAAWLRCEK